MRYLFNAILAFALLAASVDASIAEETRFVDVKGIGEVEVKPDIIRISFELETYNKSLEDALDDNNERVADLIDFLKDFGIAEKDFSTSNVSINTIYAYDYC